MSTGPVLMLLAGPALIIAGAAFGPVGVRAALAAGIAIIGIKLVVRWRGGTARTWGAIALAGVVVLALGALLGNIAGIGAVAWAPAGIAMVVPGVLGLVARLGGDEVVAAAGRQAGR